LDQGIENRLVICGLICDPSPKINLPSETKLRSYPMLAKIMGFLEKATAMDVINSTFSVAIAAETRGRNGS